MIGRPPVYPLRAMKIGDVIFVQAHKTPLRILQQTIGSAIGQLRRRYGCPNRYRTHQVTDRGFEGVGVRRVA